jgi:hypothetical protein
MRGSGWGGALSAKYEGVVVVFVVTMQYLERLLTVHIEPVCADEMLLVEHCVIRTQEVKILELK